jgi:dTDP-4-amino-4,6-dideoxygalactose transaminase
VATEPGAKLNMTDLHAALGIHQLPRLDGWIERRAELWERYDELLAGLPLELPSPPPDHVRHARHLYRVALADEADVTRDEVLDALDAQRIGAGVHYLAVHLHPYYRDRYALSPGDFPVADRMSERTLSLPLSPKVSEEDQDDVVAAVRQSLRAGVLER